MAILQDTLLYKGFNGQKVKTIKFTHLLTKNHTNYKSYFVIDESRHDKGSYMERYFNLVLTEFDLTIPFHIGPFLMTSGQFNLNPPQLITIFNNLRR